MSLTSIIKKLFREEPQAVVKTSSNTLRETNSVRDPNTSRQWITNPWHAVSIVPCRQACARAQSALGERYLSSDAPDLPLTGCTQVTCQCRYRHHEDRRHDLRRAGDIWGGRPFAGQERRGARGRRATDIA